MKEYIKALEDFLEYLSKTKEINKSYKEQYIYHERELNLLRR